MNFTVWIRENPDGVTKKELADALDGHEFEVIVSVKRGDRPIVEKRCLAVMDWAGDDEAGKVPEGGVDA